MKKLYIFLLILLSTTISYGQGVGDIIITEIMNNPNAVADVDGEWIEVYNATDVEINLKEMKIKYGSTSTSNHKINKDVIVPAKGFVVLGKNSDYTTNGGVNIDYQYVSSISLGNSSYILGIVHSDGSTIIDEVVWDNGATFPDLKGVSMSLMVDKLDGVLNNDGANWEKAIFPYGNGDFGTPGSKNDQALSNVKIEKEGFYLYPNPVTYGSFTVIFNKIEKKEISIYDILGSRVFNKISSSDKLEINTSNLNSGLYFVRVDDGSDVSVTKLVVK